VKSCFSSPLKTKTSRCYFDGGNTYVYQLIIVDLFVERAKLEASSWRTVVRCTSGVQEMAYTVIRTSPQARRMAMIATDEDNTCLIVELTPEETRNNHLEPIVLLIACVECHCVVFWDAKVSRTVNAYCQGRHQSTVEGRPLVYKVCSRGRCSSIYITHSQTRSIKPCQ